MQILTGYMAIARVTCSRILGYETGLPFSFLISFCIS